MGKKKEKMAPRWVPGTMRDDKNQVHQTPEERTLERECIQDEKAAEMDGPFGR